MPQSNYDSVSFIRKLFRFKFTNWSKNCDPNNNVKMYSITFFKIKKLPQLQMQTLDCLPINQNYQIGSNSRFSDNYRHISFVFKCFNPCQVDRCGAIDVFQLNSIMNLTSPQPFQYWLDQKVFDFNYYTAHQYSTLLEKNILIQDRSLLPNQHISKTTSFSHQQLRTLESLEFLEQQRTTLLIEPSQTTNTINRRFLKMIDVLSYVGGIFPTLFGVFFFMKFFGIYFFEMTFAYHHFKVKEIKLQGFGTFIKKISYDLLDWLGVTSRKNWKIARHQVKINQLVKKLLYINYLYRRIDFLESAISVVLQKHQLKGIYLSRVSVQNAENQFKMHKLRDRVITYLDKKNCQERKKQKEKDNLENEKQKEIIGVKSSKIQSHFDLNELLEVKDPPLESMKNIFKTEMIDEDQRGRNSHLNQKETDQLANLRKKQFKILLASQSSMTNIEPEEIDEEQLLQEFGGDLRILFKEAQNKKGDPVSKRIVEDMEEWLRSELQLVIDQHEQKHPKSKLQLKDHQVKND